MMSKKANFIKFFIVNPQKGRHIRKAQSMSNPNKKKIIQKAYETVVLCPKQKQENKKISSEIGIFDFYANFC